MSKAAAVKEAVKESLLGAEEPTQLSSQTKSRFHANAIKDAETGELFMGPDEFVNAVAPATEDYVSHPMASLLLPLSLVDKTTVLTCPLMACSTRSNANSTAFSSASPTARMPAASRCPSGLLSRTC